MTDLEPAKRRLLRPLTAIAGALGVALLALGALPGTAVYTDARNCFGHAVAGVFAHGGGAGPCEPHYVLDHTERVLDHPLSWLALVAMLLPGLVVWHRPRLRSALLWSLLTVALGALMIATLFELHLFDHTVTLWPAKLAGPVLLALFTTLIVVTPIACGVFAWKHRTRPAPPVELARARVVER